MAIDRVVAVICCDVCYKEVEIELHEIDHGYQNYISGFAIEELGKGGIAAGWNHDPDFGTTCCAKCQGRAEQAAERRRAEFAQRHATKGDPNADG